MKSVYTDVNAGILIFIKSTKLLNSREMRWLGRGFVWNGISQFIINVKFPHN